MGKLKTEINRSISKTDALIRQNKSWPKHLLLRQEDEEGSSCLGANARITIGAERGQKTSYGQKQVNTEKASRSEQQNR